MDDELVVESRGDPIAAERLEDERLDSLVAQRLVPAREGPQVLDAGDLEPDEIGGVVRDALGVGLREADAHGNGERKAFHQDQYQLPAAYSRAAIPIAIRYIAQGG
jgi:hypothetical protein